MCLGMDVVNQAKIDKMVIDLDGSTVKPMLRANAILGLSFAVCRVS